MVYPVNKKKTTFAHIFFLFLKRYVGITLGDRRESQIRKASNKRQLNLQQEWRCGKYLRGLTLVS